jgi:glycosyltransferase involved in cell wall biosynthesis
MVEQVISEACIGIVVIGRNEGERLQRCLLSLPRSVPIVYVDSGSTDGSVSFARSLGVDVLELDMRLPFTAARARNAGWCSLIQRHPDMEFIQFIDGDCEMAATWLHHAKDALLKGPDLAAVFGRRRERFPEKSLYNRMCDDEWNVPVGVVGSCGGDALFRRSALIAAEGFSDDLIAGEEPDLCLRLRNIGWRIRRIDAEMTLHDAAILSFASWWRRAKRSGFAYAEHVWRHGPGSDPHWRRQVSSIIFWSAILPLTLATLAVTLSIFFDLPAIFFSAGIVLIYSLQVFRIAKRKHASGSPWGYAFSHGALLVVGKFSEFTGVLKCSADHLLRRENGLIEYKDTR